MSTTPRRPRGHLDTEGPPVPETLAPQLYREFFRSSRTNRLRCPESHLTGWGISSAHLGWVARAPPALVAPVTRRDTRVPTCLLLAADPQHCSAGRESGARLLVRLAAPSSSWSFVQRRGSRGCLRELRAFQALEQAYAGDGQVVGVVAEAGVGKSGLCFEFIKRCHARGISVKEGHCPTHGKTVPYLPLLELLRGIFEIGDRDGDHESRARSVLVQTTTGPDGTTCRPPFAGTGRNLNTIHGVRPEDCQTTTAICATTSSTPCRWATPRCASSARRVRPRAGGSRRGCARYP